MGSLAGCCCVAAAAVASVGALRLAESLARIATAPRQGPPRGEAWQDGSEGGFARLDGAVPLGVRIPPE